MPGKILIVDDDREFREEFKECFDEYDIIDAANGAEGLRLLKKPNEIDLVILDVMLPDTRGTEILLEIRNLSRDVGVIILTGYSSKDVALEALRGRADEYIEKPFDIHQAKEIIERVLENKRDKETAESGHSNGKLDRVKRYVQRNCHKKISLNDVAQAVCLSPKYLSRIFKESEGKGFTEYRLSIKIEMAKELLQTSDLNVDQISEKLGYENAESFIRQFKKLTRLTPTGFRKKNKIKKKKQR